MQQHGRIGVRDALTIEAVDSLTRVPAAAWDALAGEDNPFVEHAFLASLEEAGCVGQESGWIPRYLLARSGEMLVGAAPAYIKLNSYGEYIFDWSWADAAQRSRVVYYPKLVIAVPFTPATGPRLLVHPDRDPDPIRQALARGARGLAERLNLQSVHWLFTTEAEAKLLASEGYRHRLSYQFHWRNRGYESFEDFLAALRSKRRKEVRRERRRAASADVVVAVEQGKDLSSEDWDRLHRCYLNTIEDRWAIPYLNPRWFGDLGERLGHRSVVVTVRREGRLVGGALAFRKGRHLYGRYWGCLESHDALHFEVCYYQLVEYAIKNGLALVEAGAQGHHKLARGFEASLTHSAHWLRHPGLADAVYDFIGREAESVTEQVAAYQSRTPFSGER